MSEFAITRPDLVRVFGSGPAVFQFETLQRKVAEHEDSIAAGVEDTAALKDASFVTLSRNTDLTNEYVLQVGPGLSLAAADGVVQLTMQAPIVVGGTVRFTVPGDCSLALPVTGVVATREWFPGPYADDAAAATGGVNVGECYRKGDGTASVPATRMT